MILYKFDFHIILVGHLSYHKQYGFNLTSKKLALIIFSFQCGFMSSLRILGSQPGLSYFIMIQLLRLGSFGTLRSGYHFGQANR